MPSCCPAFPFYSGGAVDAFWEKKISETTIGPGHPSLGFLDIKPDGEYEPLVLQRGFAGPGGTVVEEFPNAQYWRVE